MNNHFTRSVNVVVSGKSYFLPAAIFDRGFSTDPISAGDDFAVISEASPRGLKEQRAKDSDKNDRALPRFERKARRCGSVVLNEFDQSTPIPDFGVQPAFPPNSQTLLVRNVLA